MSGFLNKVKDFFLKVKEKIRSDIHKFTAPASNIHNAPAESENMEESFAIDEAPKEALIDDESSTGDFVVNAKDITTEYSPGVDSASASPN